MENRIDVFGGARWIGKRRNHAWYKDELTPTLRGIKVFDLSSVPNRATVRVSGLGAFVLYINGKRVSDEILSPAFTSYHKTVLYCEYDVTGMLRSGKNTVAIEVGAGYFNQNLDDVWSFRHAPWRDCEKFILCLVADGRNILVSDRSWRVKHEGPRYHTQIRQGEYYDATLEDGWLDEDFDPLVWDSAVLTSPPGGALKKQELPPIRICEILRPKSRIKGKNGIIFDFGKNISGVCRIRMQAPAGTEIKISYGELLSASGDELSREGIDQLVGCEERYTDKYVFSGHGTETFAAEFVYHGFQFAEISGAAPEMDEIEALFIHTDLREKGGFDSSDDTFNWIVNAGVTSILSNFHGFSEDCPHREKNGWTGDAVITAENAVYRFDMKEAYKKWLGDIMDTQLPSGQLSCIAPTGGWGYVWGCGPAWDTALLSIPEAYYKETGDKELLMYVFDAAERYLEYTKHYEENGGLVAFGLGDWCAPTDNTGHRIPVVSNEFSDCCQYVNMLRIMELACELKGDLAKAKIYRERKEGILEDTRRRFLRDGDADNSTPSALALAVYYGIAEGENAKKLADKLAKSVSDNGYRACAGILGMKAFFTVLSEHGHIDTVNKFVHCEEHPSYGFWRKNGATSLWECWFTNSSSRNHHMYSEVLNWIYRYIGGIQNLGIAYDRCTVAPYIFAEGACAQAFTETPRGRLSARWSYNEGVFKGEFEIPEGTEATLRIGGTETPLPVGKSTVEQRL